jgi:TatD DNase family protein
MPLIDTHCHLTFSPLAEDIDQVIQRSIAAGITGWIAVGTDLEHSQRASDLATRIPNLFVAVGIHPHQAKEVTDDNLDRLVRLAKGEKVVAIGETGLDLHYLHSPVEDQKRVFVWHLELAAQLGLPLVVHCREAFDQTLDVLDRYCDDSTPIVFHCFTGTMAQALAVIDRGFFLSFSGVVTFKNAKEVQEAAGNVPLDRVLIETDCPYLSPEPMRKQRANEPALMVHTARFVAGLRGMDLESLAETLTGNARRFFHLP